jgi:nucleotidyltransferase substrate binding protein (TIGR01987 family)
MSEIRWKQRFENFKKANSNLIETADCIKQNELNKIYTMALIQAFEMSFELAWKTMKDYLENDGILTDSPRTTIKEAFSSRLIEDGQLWIDMMEVRNKTSLTYKEEYANIVANEILDIYISLLVKLEQTFEEK